MQKWCPEPFTVADASRLVTSVAADETYAPELPAVETESPADSARVFRSEAGFKSPDSLMSQLSIDERTLVFEMAEQDVKRQYAARETELRAELEKERAAELERVREETRAWAASYGQQHEVALRDMAAACARLAVTLAEKVIRAKVEQDPEVLARAIETALFAMGAGDALSVTVHPEDAAWLEQREDLRTSLHIGEIVPDRRVDRGGCRISCEGREWDASVAGQLETLSEVVAEWLTSATAPCPDKEHHDPAVD